MAGEEQKVPPHKPPSGNIPPQKLRPGSGTSPASSTNKFPPVGGGSAKGPASTGKFLPVGGVGTGKFTPVGSGQGTGKFTPVGPGQGTGKFNPVGSGAGKVTPVGAGTPPRTATPPPSPAPQPPKFAQIPVPPKPASGIGNGTGTGAVKDSKAVTSTGSFPKPDNKAVTSTGSFPRPDTGARPRSAPPPGVSGRLTLGQMTNLTVGPQKPGSKVVGQWSCSACGKALNPQSVMQGTGLIIDGSLMCVECVKAGGVKRGKAAPLISGATLLIVGASVVGVLGVVGIFLPSQVLLIVLLLSAAAVLVGLIGFTLSGAARLGTIAAGLVVMAASVFGLITIRERSSQQQVRSVLSAQNDKVKVKLDNDYIVEARILVGQLEESAIKTSHGQLSKAEEEGIAELKELVGAWVRKNFGQITAGEQAVLFQLYSRLGSLTPKSKTRSIRAIKLAGNALHFTMAYDAPGAAGDSETDGPKVRHDGLQDKRDTAGIIGDPLQEQTARVYQWLLSASPKTDSFELKIVTAALGESTELYSDTLTADEIKGLIKDQVKLLQRGVTAQKPKPANP